MRSPKWYKVVSSIFYVHPLLGEDFQFELIFFQWVELKLKPPTSCLHPGKSTWNPKITHLQRKKHLRNLNYCVHVIFSKMCRYVGHIYWNLHLEKTWPVLNCSSFPMSIPKMTQAFGDTWIEESCCSSNIHWEAESTHHYLLLQIVSGATFVSGIGPCVKPT